MLAEFALIFTLMSRKHRFFMALLPPQPIQDYASNIKQYFADRYASQAALRSPPHITLQSPFEWTNSDMLRLEEALAEFAIACPPIPITLEGFAAFPPRVIYINVLKTPALLTLQYDLSNYCESKLGIIDPVNKQRPFAPHLTVAFRDLTKPNFKAAWPEFQNQSVHFEFMATQITLLLHSSQQWTVYRDFPFSA
jgi:2'-5' RNA ligase